jgi:hypothetical protein
MCCVQVHSEVPQPSMSNCNLIQALTFFYESVNEALYRNRFFTVVLHE